MYSAGMPRQMPAQRFQDLVEAATGVFIAQGYRRTQMADVAEALGVAKGTLYLCVESKEALFDVALRYADVPRPIVAPATLPIPAPGRGRTFRYVQERLSSDPASPTLREALGRGRVGTGAAELAKIVRELHQAMARNRTGIKLVDRSAAEYPELAKVWFGQGRGALLAQLTTYLEGGIRRQRFRAVPDPAVAARLVMETLVFWAVHRHWDPAPQPVDPRAVEETVVQMLVDALAERTRPAGTRPPTRRRRPRT
jgi:AcrR family transcriptional regulator